MLIRILTILLLSAATATASPLDNIIIGDSLSVFGGINDTPPFWPDIAFSADHTNLAVGGTTTDDWVNDTAGVPVNWENVAAPGQTWWLLVGTNNEALKVAQGLDFDYRGDMEEIVDRLIVRGVTEIHLIHSPRWFLIYWHPSVNQVVNLGIASLRDIDRDICNANPEVFCDMDLYEAMQWSGDYDAGGVHFSLQGHSKAATLAVPEPESWMMLTTALIALATLKTFRR